MQTSLAPTKHQRYLYYDTPGYPSDKSIEMGTASPPRSRSLIDFTFWGLVTICVLSEPDGRDVYVGHSRCNSNEQDTYDRRVGMEIAFKRALREREMLRKIDRLDKLLYENH
jgi:hypothetical protein